jgi:hypothetical protein
VFAQHDRCLLFHALEHEFRDLRNEALQDLLRKRLSLIFGQVVDRKGLLK